MGRRKEAPQWTTSTCLHNEGWLDYNQCQTGHGKFANEMVPECVIKDYKLVPTKPIVVTEPWYEFREGEAESRDIRYGAWSSILSGSAGHTYGGGRIWRADFKSISNSGNNETTQNIDNTFNYEGAVSMKHLASFFHKIPWFNMVPHPELVSDYPQAYCLAVPNQEYVVYLRYGGVAKVNLKNPGQVINYQYTWFDPANGTYTETKTVQGTGNVNFACPNPRNLDVCENKDWVLYVKKANE